MDGALASVIAVAGTLLGSVVTYAFQRINTDRAEQLARKERLRQERMVTYSAFAGAITDLRRGVITLWFTQRSESEGTQILAAHVDADRLGAAAHHARFRVQLVAEDPDLVSLADAAFDPIDAIRDAADRGELKLHEDRCEAALEAFVTAAAAQVR